MNLVFYVRCVLTGLALLTFTIAGYPMPDGSAHAEEMRIVQEATQIPASSVAEFDNSVPDKSPDLAPTQDAIQKASDDRVANNNSHSSSSTARGPVRRLITLPFRVARNMRARVSSRVAVRAGRRASRAAGRANASACRASN